MIIEETLRQRYQGVKNEAGVWVTPAFPKLIYVLEEDNIRPGTPVLLSDRAGRQVHRQAHGAGLYLRKEDAGAEGGQKRRRPLLHLHGLPQLPDPLCGPRDRQAQILRAVQSGRCHHQSAGRGAGSGKGNFEKFWKIFDERLELCHRALQCRHKRLKGTLSDAAPILWQYGALARLKKGEKIDKLLFGGYSTISLGYAGLYECVKYMTGKSHTDAGAKPFALSVMQHMNDKCNGGRAENIDYSLYGTPLESTTYKFAKCLQKRFGIMPGITDKGYITNSYHVHVSEQIDAFTKLKFECDFQRSVPGRCHQLCGSAQHAGQSGSRDECAAVHLRQHHVCRAEHQV